MNIWGPWLTYGMPSLGDYIQAEGYQEHFEMIKWETEGYVTLIEGGIVYVNDETPQMAVSRIVDRWRKRIFKINTGVSEQRILEMEK
jgi:hypothetical protein